MSELHTSVRAKCGQCLRPISYCLCAHVATVANRVRVLILQHPDEQKHPLNTARLAVLGLLNAELLVGECFTQLNERLLAVDSAFLLFPEIEGCAVQPLVPISEDRSSLLIVPDGTWRNVRKIIQLNPLLSALPFLSLPVGEPSQYRVRKAREPAAVSTIEAIVRTLTLLEPEHDFSPVLEPFHALVEQQIKAMGAEVYKRNYQ